MATAVPCVVTDVGDSALLVGEAGFVVEPGDADALAAGILNMLARSAEERQSLGASATARIRDRFGLDRMAEAYADLYREVLAA
jgi:glycosyltransferase involved in cell wall biosynthesis